MTRAELEATLRDALTERLKGLSAPEKIKEAIIDVLKEHVPPEPKITVTQDPDDPTKVHITFDPTFLFWYPRGA